MADVFISYATARRSLTKDLAADIERAGFSVWWDTSLLPNQTFRREIDIQLDACKAAIIIWTPESIDSDWVTAEADHARAQGKLINTRTPDLQAIRIPKPFNQTHAVAINERAAILAAIESLVDGVDLPPRTAQVANEPRRKPRSWSKSLLRVLAYVAAGTVLLAALVFGLILWRLSSGPIDIGFAVRRVEAAIQEKLGGGLIVQVGAVQLERTEADYIAVRGRDVVFRDSDGAVVAQVPKVEVGLSNFIAVSGPLHVDSMALVGVELAVTIAPNGNMRVSAGKAGTSTPVGGASGIEAAPASLMTPGLVRVLATTDDITARWLDRGSRSSLGIKSGLLIVSDERSGKIYQYQDVNLAATRGEGGGIHIALSTGEADGSMSTAAADIKRRPDGGHSISLNGRDLALSDLLLAPGWDDLDIHAGLSFTLSAEFGPDAIPESVKGRILANKGYLGDPASTAGTVPIDSAETNIEWDRTSATLIAPIQLMSGGSRITTTAKLQTPAAADEQWIATLQGGSLVLAGDAAYGDALVLDQIDLHATFDPGGRTFEIKRGLLGGRTANVAVTGNISLSGREPRVAVGIATSPMSVGTLTRLWPAPLVPRLRDWVMNAVSRGTIERLHIAIDAPLAALRRSGPPLLQNELSVEIAVKGATIRPVADLPAVRDADVTVQIDGSAAVVTVPKGTIDLPSGRSLAVSKAKFEVPDLQSRTTPLTRTTFQIEGQAAAAAELLAMEPLRNRVSTPPGVSNIRGTVVADVAIGLPLTPYPPAASLNYTVRLQASNFAADNLVGKRIEAPSLRVFATAQGYAIEGDAKVDGIAKRIDAVSGAQTGAEIRAAGDVIPSTLRRTALVIGNSTYRDLPPLITPANDAVAIANAFRLAGFQSVQLEQDLTRERLVDVLQGFATTVDNHDLAVVYFAGHAIALGGANHLIPINATLANPREVQFQAVPLGLVLDVVKSAKKAGLVILDAARDNPYVARMRTAGMTQSLSRGLVTVTPPPGALVFYPARPGQLALDGGGKNSPFADALARRIASPGVDIRKLLELVRDDVARATNQQQSPFIAGSVAGREDISFAQR
jgi:hypothetical protein